MQSEQPQSAQTITIYKAPQKGKGQKLLKEGFQSVDFPYNPPYVDGSCYFDGPNDRSIAEEFHQSYKEGVLEVAIDRENYDRYFTVWCKLTRACSGCPKHSGDDSKTLAIAEAQAVGLLHISVGAASQVYLPKFSIKACYRLKP